MTHFQNKVTALRRYESISYTICLSVLDDERAASKAAEQVLLQLFSDDEFWQLEESQHSTYIFQVCLSICLPQIQRCQMQASS